MVISEWWSLKWVCVVPFGADLPSMAFTSSQFVLGCLSQIFLYKITTTLPFDTGISGITNLCTGHQRSNLFAAISWIFLHVYYEARRRTWQMKVLKDTMGAANDSYKRDTFVLQGFLRVNSNIRADFDGNIQPEQTAGEFYSVKTAF